MSDVKAIASFLAREHRNEDSTIEEVYWLPDDDEVRLIEVTKSVPADGTIMPFRFAPDADIPVPSLIVLLHPDDWTRRVDLKWPSELDPEKNSATRIEAQNGERSSHMERDPIIDEIHQIREAFAKEHNYDLAAMVRTLIRHQHEGGRQVVSFAPRRVSTDALSPSQGSVAAQPANAADSSGK